jgi:hypothetical protein
VVPIAQKTIEAHGLSDRITASSVDIFSEPLPKADVITMGMILHDWNLEKKMQLIQSAYDALPSGGAFAVIENLIDDERRKNTFGLMMSLNMLIEFGDAFDFTGRDFDGWCRKIGFVARRSRWQACVSTDFRLTNSCCINRTHSAYFFSASSSRIFRRCRIF